MAEIKRLNTELTSKDISALTFHLLNTPLYLPDTLRDMKNLLGSITSVVASSPEPYGIYSNGDLRGVFLVTDIIVGHEARFLMWVWDSKGYTPTVARWVGDYLDAIRDTYGLVRIVAQTPCQKLGRMLKRLGFGEEGRFKRGYKHLGKFHTLYQYRRLA